MARPACSSGLSIQHGAGKAFVFVVVALFAWHAVHRIFHSLHDAGVHAGTLGKIACYGSALAITAITAAGCVAMKKK